MLLKLSAQIKQTNHDWYDVSLDKIGFLIKVYHSWPTKMIEVKIPFRITESSAPKTQGPDQTNKQIRTGMTLLWTK